MTIHVKFHTDPIDNCVIDVDQYCSELCYWEAGHTEVGAWPCGIESDTCVTCATCDEVVVHGIEECTHCSDCGIDNSIEQNAYCTTCNS